MDTKTKNVKKCSINYIISFVIWNILFAWLFSPLFEYLIHTVSEELLGELNYYTTLKIVGCINLILYVLLNYFTNKIAVRSALKKVSQISQSEINKFLGDSSCYFIIYNIFLMIFSYSTTIQFSIMNLIFNILIAIISLFLFYNYNIRYIKKYR